MWTTALEASASELIARIVDGATPVAERNNAWKRFLAAISPSIEQWSGRHPLLRRCGLTGEDEPRAILLAVINRLAARDFENLRRFRASLPPAREDAEPALENLERLATVDEPEPELASSTPVRAWLLTLVGFVVKDHVRQRLGWRSTSHTEFPLAKSDAASTQKALAEAVRAVRGVIKAEIDANRLTVEHSHDALEPLLAAIERCGWIATVPPPVDKRAVGSGAATLSSAGEVGERPGMTDHLTLMRLLAEIREHAAGFPAPMREALALWMDDVPYPEIASRLGVDDADGARALVRAAHARLRERFRDEWPAWFEK